MILQIVQRVFEFWSLLKNRIFVWADYSTSREYCLVLINVYLQQSLDHLQGHSSPLRGRVHREGPIDELDALGLGDFA